MVLVLGYPTDGSFSCSLLLLELFYGLPVHFVRSLPFSCPLLLLKLLGDTADLSSRSSSNRSSSSSSSSSSK